MSIYKDCDIRGIYEKELREDEVNRIGKALGTLCGGKTVLVGGDVRLSTPSLKKELVDGLLAVGTRVVDLGTIPTPALYYALKKRPGAAGMTVTASHNPPEYNGVKFMLDDRPVNRETMNRVEALVKENSFAEKSGILESVDGATEYLDSFRGRFSAPRPLHVLVDAGNGAMSRIAPAAFRAAGYRVTEKSCVPDGHFPDRSPNPSDYKNLKGTEEAVRTCGADFGVSFDGDGDRAVFLDETGAPVQNEKALVLFVRSLLKNHPTPVVYDQKASSAVKKAILEMGGTPLPEKSGHAFIKRRFLDNGAAVAGEVSGHFFFGELGYDDGLFAALTMAELLGRSEKSLRELTEEIICPPITPDIRFFCPYDRQEECLARIEQLAAEGGASVSRLDGVRAEFADGWVLIRKSVTAEQVTLRAEAETAEKLKNLLARVSAVLPSEAQKAIAEI